MMLSPSGSFDRRILSRKTLLACVAGSNLVVRRIPFPDVAHGENGRAKISATHNEDQDEGKKQIARLAN